MAMKKVMAALMSLVMVICILPVSALADSTYDTALSIELGEKQEEKSVADMWYKVKTEKGVLQVDFTTNYIYSNVLVMDEDGALLKVRDLTYKSGEALQGGKSDEFVFSTYNENTKKTKLTAKYDVGAGEYYIRVTNNDWYYSYPGSMGVEYHRQKGDITLTASMAEDAKDAQIEYLCVPMKKGATLKLSAVFTVKGASAKWSSSKPSVVSVSSKGTLTAKKKGTAIITASCGGSEVKLKIKVS